MIKNKKYFVFSLSLLVFCIIVNVILTKYDFFKNSTGTILSIPIWSNNEYFFIGISLLIIEILALVLLFISLNKKRFASILIAIIMTIILPKIVFTIL